MVWFRGWDLGRLQDNLDVAVEGDPDGLDCTIPTPPDSLGKTSLDDQAGALAAFAMERVTEPLLGAAGLSRRNP